MRAVFPLICKNYKAHLITQKPTQSCCRQQCSLLIFGCVVSFSVYKAVNQHGAISLWQLWFVVVLPLTNCVCTQCLAGGFFLAGTHYPLERENQELFLQSCKALIAPLVLWSPEVFSTLLNWALCLSHTHTHNPLCAPGFSGLCLFGTR